MNKLSTANFLDGRLTASASRDGLKKNKQFLIEHQDKELHSFVTDKILANKTFELATRTRTITSIMVNKYELGEYYGWHVDSASMSGKRSDMSFTIFLQDPNLYDGGELEIQVDNQKTSVKLNPGEMIIYPTGALHQVTEVTRGTRLCIVGWIESFIPSEEERAMLWKLGNSIGKLDITKNFDDADILKFKEIYNNLVRYFSR